MSRRKIRKWSPQRNVPNEGGLGFFDDFQPICRHISKTVHFRHKVTMGRYRKPYASYRMVSLSMTFSDLCPGFQVHGSFKRRISPKRRILQTQLLYRTLIGNQRQAIDRRKLAIQLTTPLLLHKPCNRFASVAHVCQRQLAFLVVTYYRRLHFTFSVWMVWLADSVVVRFVAILNLNSF